MAIDGGRFDDAVFVGLPPEFLAGPGVEAEDGAAGLFRGLRVFEDVAVAAGHINEVVAKDGQYQLELQPTSNNTDPRDSSEYLVGGDPRLLVEHVAPIPLSVDAPIQVVWPRDPRAANVSGVLLSPGTTQPVPCRWNPTVRLYASVDGGPTVLAGTAAKRLVSQDGLSYPVWDFNAVDISPAAQGKSIDFWLDVNGVATHATRWTYSMTQDWPPFWQQRPTVSCAP